MFLILRAWAGLLRHSGMFFRKIASTDWVFEIYRMFEFSTKNYISQSLDPEY